MAQRSLFEAVTDFMTGLAGPHVRAARARLRRIQFLDWPGFLPRWEHVKDPTPIAIGEDQGKVVARISREASQLPTLLSGGYFDSAMADTGDPEHVPVETGEPVHPLRLGADGHAVWGERDTSWRRKIIGLDENGDFRVYQPDNPAMPAARERYLKMVKGEGTRKSGEVSVQVNAVAPGRRRQARSN